MDCGWPTWTNRIFAAKNYRVKNIFHQFIKFHLPNLHSPMTNSLYFLDIFKFFENLSLGKVLFLWGCWVSICHKLLPNFEVWPLLQSRSLLWYPWFTIITSELVCSLHQYFRHLPLFLLLHPMMLLFLVTAFIFFHLHRLLRKYC